MPEGATQPRRADSTLVKAILDVKQGPEVTMARVLDAFPLQWTEQRYFSS